MKNDFEKTVKEIKDGKCSLGIEFGSTRIKAVLIGQDRLPIAYGIYDWENKFENGVWTYDLENVLIGLRSCFADLKKNVCEKYGQKLSALSYVGISGMMHGYLAFDKDWNLLVPFRTWRNTITQRASSKLSKLFGYNIPQRWSIAHLYEAILNKEEHLSRIAHITTLAGYVHFLLSGENAVGANEASGMLALDEDGGFNKRMVKMFNELISDEYSFKLEDIFPKVLCAGEVAGVLTKEGALLLDPTGELSCGAIMCPPEGDGGTGMVATNSVREKTGNISVGTSIFLMAVLQRPLTNYYPEIDVVATPDGKTVAMVHGNNGTSDVDCWVNIFAQFAAAAGMDISKGKIYETLYNSALCADANCAGLVNINYLSGEHITGFASGVPLFARGENAKFTLANFMRANLFSIVSTIRIGFEMLLKENISLERIIGHGGFFKTDVVGQKIIAAALRTPVTVSDMAGEGGAWGIALLAAYIEQKKSGKSLAEYLDEVFSLSNTFTQEPDSEDIKGFNEYFEKYKAALLVEKSAVENL